MFKFALFCHVDNFHSTMFTNFGSNQIWECALNMFTMEPIHKNLTFVTSAIQGHHILNTFFCWSPYTNDSQLMCNFAWHSNTTYPNTSTIGMFSWASVSRCKSMWKVHNCRTVASNCKVSQKIIETMISRFVSLFE